MFKYKKPGRMEAAVGRGGGGGGGGNKRVERSGNL